MLIIFTGGELSKLEAIAMPSPTDCFVNYTHYYK